MPLLSKWLTRARLSRVREHIGKNVVDLGCGYGELLDFLPANVNRVVLVDRSPERRSRIERRIEGKGISAKFVLQDIEEDGWSHRMGYADTVVMAAVLEHLKDPLAVLRQAYQLLEPGGNLIMTTPSPLGGKLHWVGSLLRLTYPEAAAEHEAFYDQGGMQLLLSKSGFKIVHYRRFLLGLNQLIVARK